MQEAREGKKGSFWTWGRFVVSGLLHGPWIPVLFATFFLFDDPTSGRLLVALAWLILILMLLYPTVFLVTLIWAIVTAQKGNAERARILSFVSLWHILAIVVLYTILFSF